MANTPFTRVRHSSSTTMKAALVELDTGIVGQQSIGERTPADGDDQLVHLDRLRPVLVLVIDLYAVLALGRRTDFRPEPDIEALFLEVAGGGIGDVAIRHEQEVLHGFENRDLRTQPRPDAAEFQADDAGTDDAEPFRYRAQFERIPGIDDRLAIEFRETAALSVRIPTPG